MLFSIATDFFVTMPDVEEDGRKWSLSKAKEESPRSTHKLPAWEQQQRPDEEEVRLFTAGPTKTESHFARSSQCRKWTVTGQNRMFVFRAKCNGQSGMLRQTLDLDFPFALFSWGVQDMHC